jgi:DNA-binding transcriptional ArsR family regulator
LAAPPDRADLDRFAEMFKALSHPKRLEIYLRLVRCCPATPFASTTEEFGACVGELGQDLALAPSTVSHHIKELRRAGLITCERQGQTVRCCVDEGIWRELARFFGLATN